MIGNNLSRNAEITMKITESLISFTSYIGTSIKTLRIPLKNIYSNFENEDLTEIGFISELKELGLSKAVEKLEGILTQEGLNAMNYLNSNLGGIDINDQYNLCLYVENKLKVELENIKKKYKERKRERKITFLNKSSVNKVRVEGRKMGGKKEKGDREEERRMKEMVKE